MHECNFKCKNDVIASPGQCRYRGILQYTWKAPVLYKATSAERLTDKLTVFLLYLIE